MDSTKTYSLITAILDFFGRKPGQSTSDFTTEVKQLTDLDRAEFKADLQARGYKIV